MVVVGGGQSGENRVSALPDGKYPDFQSGYWRGDFWEKWGKLFIFPGNVENGMLNWGETVEIDDSEKDAGF